MKTFNGVVYFKKSPVQHNIYVEASLKYLGGVGYSCILNSGANCHDWCDVHYHSTNYTMYY